MRRLPIKTYVLLPIVVALATLLAAFVWEAHRDRQGRLDAAATRDLHSLQNLLMLQLEREAATMRVALVALMRDKRLQAAFEAADREAIAEQVQPLFERLHEEHGVTHFYFVAPDRECIVRVHKPEFYGDIIERITMRRAEETGEQVWGVELGPLGTCTLRVVMPWRTEKGLVGFVELGEEVESITEKIRKATGAHLVVVIRKEHIEREGWEQGMEMLGRDANWDQFPDVVLVGEIPRVAPPGFLRTLGDVLANPDASRTLLSENTRFRIDSFELHDMAERHIGYMVVLRDVTEEHEAARVSVVLTTGLSAGVGGALFVFFYLLLDRLQRKLGREFGERQKAEQKLREHRDQLEETVTLRTRHLRESNEELQREIVDRRKAEEEALKLRALLKSMTDSMPSVLVAVDRQANVTQWNQQAEKATGLSAEQVLGKPLAEVFPQLPNQSERVYKAISTGQTQTELKVPSQREGETRYADITVYPLSGPGIEGAVLRLDDITERVRIEEMMAQTEKMLSIGGLAAGMAHEINNPLGGILHGVQVIQKRLSPTISRNLEAAREAGADLQAIRAYLEQREILTFLTRIRESGERASKIVSNMLQFSRKSDAHLTPVDLAALIERAVELAASDYDLKKDYDFRQIKITREFAPDLPPVPAVETEIEQVVLNLLKNAAQAMQEIGGVKDRRISLRTGRVDEWAQIEIEDNGPGMSQEIRKRAFEPFFTTKGMGDGTGLGLSVSYTIVTTNHRGSMTVDSVPGAGTTFRIRLPLHRNAQ
ncbi:MAG: PAS domain S-box protein [Phycisphaerales bacterium]|nr:MAG: PAS domain S-box protein [Phycisphaerales bacterium]